MSSQDPIPGPSGSGTPELSGPVAGRGLGAVPLLLSSPTAAFRHLAADPQWIGPFVLVLLLFAAATWIRLPLDLEYGYEAARAGMERFGLAEEEVAKALESIPDPDGLTPGTTALQVLQGVGGVAAVSFLGVLALWAIARMGGPEASFHQVSAVFWMARVAAAAGALLLAVLVRVSGTVEISLGPDALVPGLAWGSLPALVLETFNLFSLLFLFLLVTGIRVVLRTSRGVARGIGGGYWLLASLVALAFKIFGSWMANTL